MHKYSQYNVSKSDICVDLGAGHPDTKNLPMNFFKETLIEYGTNLKDPSILQYGMINGYTEFRESLANWLNTKKYSNHIVNKDELFITNGVTGGLQVLINEYLSTEDTILVEEPSYFLAINIFKEYGLNVDYIPMKNDGLDVEILEEKLRKYSEKQKSIFLYTIPTCHNPTGITLSDEKRKQLAAIATVYTNFYVIADEVYHFLRWTENDNILPMSDYHPNFISLGSFSKILAPSLRVGWIYINSNVDDKPEEPTVIEDISSNSLFNSSGGISVLGSLIVHKAIDTGFLDKYLNKTISDLKERYNSIKLILKDQTQFKFEEPTGGYFMWLKSNINTQTVLDNAKLYKVKYQPGHKFSCNDKLNEYLRISFSCYDKSSLSIGINRLIKCFDEFNKTKITIMGNGKMGNAIKNLLTSKFNKKYLINSIIKKDDFDKIETINKLKLTDLIIDVSSVDGTINLINFLEKNKIYKSILCGTRGHCEKSVSIMRNYGKKINIMNINNFSKGIPILKNLTRFINKLSDDWDIKIVEYSNPLMKNSSFETTKIIESLILKKCIVENKEATIECHKIICSNNNEILELSHQAMDINIFAQGCIDMIPKLLNENKGFITDLNLPREETENKIYFAHGNIIAVIENYTGIDHNNKVIKLIKEYPEIDGVMFIYNVIINKSSCDWVYYNHNGTKIDFCGNALRCLVKYMYETYNLECLNLKYESSDLFLTRYNDGNIMIQSPDHIEEDEFSHIMQSNLENECEKLGLEVIDMELHHVGVPQLIIELKEDVLSITEVLEVLGTIIYETFCENINKEGVNISFINLNSDMINHSIDIVTWIKGMNKITESCGSGSLASFYYYLNDNTIREHHVSVNINYYNGTTMQVIEEGYLVYLMGKINEYDSNQIDDQIKNLYDIGYE
tara:strand:+ start:190 stop:2910 length:2721 start_codon:yes stop_codon:yes gene_type:complete